MTNTDALQHMRCGLLLVLLLAMPLPTSAGASETATRITLSAQAIAEYPNDEAVIRFHVAAEGNDGDALRQQVNRTSHAIQRLLSRYQGVQLTTMNRRMVPLQHYDKKRRQSVTDGWRLVQESRAVTPKLATIPDWLAAIEKNGGRLDSLTLRLSEAAKQAANTTLLTRAIAHFRSKAQTIASALGSESFTILTMNSEPFLPAPRPMMARAGMLKSVSAPAINSGASSLRIRISGQILLPPRKFSTQP